MHFDQFARDYKQQLDQPLSKLGEETEYFAEYKARYLTRVLPKGFAGKVLDYGCGIGLLSGFFKKHLPNARVDGYDVSTESIEHVDPSLSQAGLFTCEEKLLATDYDLIIVANVMHHVEPADRQRTLREISSRLKRGGRLAVFEHNPSNPVTRWVVEHCAFDEGVILLPPKETLGYFEAAGLGSLRRDYIVFMPRPLSWLRGMEPWLASLPLGAQYVVMGEARG